MRREGTRTRSPVRREQAESYLLASLVAFAATVIFTRAFLESTGYPQIGNSVLHIAHALWGGLMLFIAVLLLLALANRWAIKVSALLGGVGIGLFIDEVGKFITQANDYFYPPALSLIYGFFLLIAFVYVGFRRSQRQDPREAMYHVLEGLQDILDGDLGPQEAARLEAQLALGKQSDREEILSLVDALSGFLQKEERGLAAANSGFRRRTATRVGTLGRRLARRTHRAIIAAMLIFWVVFVIGYIVILVQGGANLDRQVVQWRGPLIAIQVLVGGLMVGGLFAWLAGSEALGMRLAVSGILLSLVALQTLYFYLSQFSAVLATLIQFVLLQVLLAYRRWHITGAESGPEPDPN